MIKKKNTINAEIFKGDEKGYVGSCIDLPVVTQGKTIDEVMSNLKEAVGLHLEGEDPADRDYVENPEIFIIYELDTFYAGI